jgi:hypothetical protein
MTTPRPTRCLLLLIIVEGARAASGELRTISVLLGAGPRVKYTYDTFIRGRTYLLFCPTALPPAVKKS